VSSRSRCQRVRAGAPDVAARQVARRNAGGRGRTHAKENKGRQAAIRPGGVPRPIGRHGWRRTVSPLLSSAARTWSEPALAIAAACVHAAASGDGGGSVNTPNGAGGARSRGCGIDDAVAAAASSWQRVEAPGAATLWPELCPTPSRVGASSCRQPPANKPVTQLPFPGVVSSARRASSCPVAYEDSTRNHPLLGPPQHTRSRGTRKARKTGTSGGPQLCRDG